MDSIKKYTGGSLVLAWLLTLNVGVSVMLWLVNGLGAMMHLNTGWTFTWFALSSGFMTFLTHPWTIVTYMVVQYGLLHLIFNVLWLYWFGLMLLDYRNERTLLYLYVGGGLAGGVCYVVASLLMGYSGGWLAGASAAVLSMMTALAILCPNREIYLWLIGAVKLKWVAIVCIVLTLAGSGSLLAPNQLAHVGGILFGAIWALGWKNFKRRTVEIGKKAPVKVRQTLRAMETHRADSVRLDELLDKIRVSGYDSLTLRERTELNEISSRMNRK